MPSSETKNISRRKYLSTNLAFLSAGLLSTCGIDDASHSPKSNSKIVIPSDKLGVQLYTVRDLFKNDFKSTLQSLHKIGYRDLEFAGYYGHNPKSIREFMDELGLVSHSTHVQIDDVRNNFDQLVNTAKIMGQSNIVVAYLPAEYRTYDGYMGLAELLNKRGEKAQNEGLRLAYHNHDFEFERIGDRVAYDILLEETDPELLFMEIDFYWAHKMRIDPIKYFKKAPDRFISCHLKDASADGKMMPVGKGIIDFTRILSAAKSTAIDYFYVENDNSPDPMQSLALSYEYIDRQYSS